MTPSSNTFKDLTGYTHFHLTHKPNAGAGRLCVCLTRPRSITFIASRRRCNKASTVTTMWTASSSAAVVLLQGGKTGSSSGKGELELVLLDHGLYKSLDAGFQLRYAQLWKALVTADEGGIRAAAAQLGAGESAELFAGILTQRPFSEVASCNVCLTERRFDRCHLGTFAEF